MRSAAGAAVLAAAAVMATGCAAPGTTPEAPAVRFQQSDEYANQPASGGSSGERSTGGRILDGVLSVPETVIWWPYKIVGGTLYGIYDGVADGVEEAPVRILGVAAAPITGTVGALRGFFRGMALDPYYVATTDEFGRVLPKPFTGE